MPYRGLITRLNFISPSSALGFSQGLVQYWRKIRKIEVKEVWNNHEMKTRNKSQNHSSSAANMFAFVYGTLKRGEPNHHWLTGTENGSATFVGTGVTQNKFPLVIASCYNIPFLIDQSGTGKNVNGEVYEIDDKMLAHLDILEEYPKLYTRREEPILITGDSHLAGQVKMAWTYLLSDFRKELLEKPFLDAYSCNGDHKLPYVASDDDLADAKDI